MDRRRGDAAMLNALIRRKVAPRNRSPPTVEALKAEVPHASFVEAKGVTNLVAHGLDDLRT
jgi:hypothetical protein